MTGVDTVGDNESWQVELRVGVFAPSSGQFNSTGLNGLAFQLIILAAEFALNLWKWGGLLRGGALHLTETLQKRFAPFCHR
jgi:hypothetical protein